MLGRAPGLGRRILAWLPSVGGAARREAVTSWHHRSEVLQPHEGLEGGGWGAGEPRVALAQSGIPGVSQGHQEAEGMKDGRGRVGPGMPGKELGSHQGLGQQVPRGWGRAPRQVGVAGRPRAAQCAGGPAHPGQGAQTTLTAECDHWSHETGRQGAGCLKSPLAPMLPPAHLGAVPASPALPRTCLVRQGGGTPG